MHQFIYGLFGDNYAYIRSGFASEFLSEEAQNFLQHIGDRLAEEKDIWNILEGILAISFIRFKRDRYSRQAVWNHTFLVKFEDYLQRTQPISIFKPYFIKELGEMPKSLEPIEIS